MNGLAWLFQLKVLALNIRHQIRKVEVQLAGALSTYCTVWWSQVVCTPFSFPTSILNNSWAATFLGDTWQSLFGVRQKNTLDFKVLVLVNFWSKNENIWSWTIRQILFLVWKFKWDICGHFPTMWTVWLLSSFKTLLLFVCVWRTKELLMSLIIIRVLITLTTIFMVFNEGDGCYGAHGGYVILIFLPYAFL